MTYIPAASGIGSVGAPDLNIGALLIGWNGVDLTQFDAVPKDYERDLGSPAGGNAETALVVTVVADPLAPLFTGNVLRFTGTAMQGGGILAYSLASLTLPARFVVVVGFRSLQSGSFGHQGFVNFNDSTVDDMQGMYVGRDAQGSVNTMRPIVSNRFGANQESFLSSGTLDALALARGGCTQVITVHKRPTGETPATALVTCVDSVSTDNVAHDTTLPHAIAGVGTAWDGRNFDRVGLQVNEGLNGSTFVTDFDRFDIYAHPDD